MVMANGDGGGRTLWRAVVYVRVHARARIRAREYRDSSLKIQMEYRAFEETRGSREGSGEVASGIQGAKRMAERGDGRGEDSTGTGGWGRYFKNRILIRAANPTLCNPYVCAGWLLRIP